MLQSYEAKEVALSKETNKKQNELRDLEKKFRQPGNLGYDHLVKMKCSMNRSLENFGQRLKGMLLKEVYGNTKKIKEKLNQFLCESRSYAEIVNNAKMSYGNSIIPDVSKVDFGEMMKETRDKKITKECESKQRSRKMEWRWMTRQRRKSKKKKKNS